MDNSNCGCECAFVKSGFCSTDKQCPFYVESWWEKEGEKQPKLVKDCSPKKLMAEQNNLLHRFLCTQGVVEDVRNRMDRIETMLTLLTCQTKEFLIENSPESLQMQKIKMQLDHKKDEIS